MKGSKLLPPLAQIPMTSFSWVECRLPELLWAVLLVGCLEREKALMCFRSVGNHILLLPDSQKIHDVTLSGLAIVEDNVFDGFCHALFLNDDVRNILNIMLFYPNLPGRNKWERYLSVPSSNPIPFLMHSVGKCLFHQTQEATDCRWIRLLCAIAANKIHLPLEILEPIVNYPNQGDQRKIRPSIRAAEIGLDYLVKRENKWPEEFWKENLKYTPCIEIPTRVPFKPPQYQLTVDKVEQVYSEIALNFLKSEANCLVNSKHDHVFGSGFYALSILKEILTIGNANGILGRLGLRTIVECYLTLAYLVKEDDPQKWASFRVFGSGQAKLTSLKIDENSSQPTYVSQEDLDAIANEDMWSEFLSIEIGHWDKTNLRNISIQSGQKDVYDMYYLWPSVFAHAHWGALRDTVFQTCGNPLHMMHRIPRKHVRFLPDVIDDATEICEKILRIINEQYPGNSCSLINRST